MNESTITNEFEIPALQIKYRLATSEQGGAIVQLSETDFEKIFQKIIIKRNI